MIKFMSLFLLLSTFAYAGVDIGYFEQVLGKVKLYHQDNPRGEKAKNDTKIYLKDIIRTKINSQATVSLNNSKITLFQKSRMIINDVEMTDAPNADIKSGRVLFDINSGDLKGMYKINTPTAVVGVKGTKFMVEVLNGYSIVTVLEGVVEVIVDGFKVNVKKGNRIRFAKDKIFLDNFYNAARHETNLSSARNLLDAPNLKPIVIENVSKNINLDISLPR